MNTWKKDWREEKGFTMAELLIVVAIIAVLAAVAIPIFTNQLEKSREGADADTIRNTYAKAAVVALEGKDYTAASEAEAKEGVVLKCAMDTSGGAVVTAGPISIDQEVQGWETAPIEIAELTIGESAQLPETSGKLSKTAYLRFEFNRYGELTGLRIASSNSNTDTDWGYLGTATTTRQNNTTEQTPTDASGEDEP